MRPFTRSLLVITFVLLLVATVFQFRACNSGRPPYNVPRPSPSAGAS